MAYLIIRQAGHPDRVWSATHLRAVVGRSERCDVQLPNVSVSRRHAELVFDDDGECTIRDLGSENGTWVNGEVTTERVIRTGDRLRIGTFGLVYIGAEVWPPTWEGRPLSDFPALRGLGGQVSGPTIQVPRHLYAEHVLQAEVAAAGVLRTTSGPARTWRPQAGRLRFGPGAEIHIESMFNRHVAEIVWTDRGHALLRRARLATVQVNGVSVSEALLRDGDRVRVGDLELIYKNPAQQRLPNTDPRANAT